jgi:Mg/Co/Ni transporter MgtE
VPAIPLTIMLTYASFELSVRRMATTDLSSQNSGNRADATVTEGELPYIGGTGAVFLAVLVTAPIASSIAHRSWKVGILVDLVLLIILVVAYLIFICLYLSALSGALESAFYLAEANPNL